MRYTRKFGRLAFAILAALALTSAAAARRGGFIDGLLRHNAVAASIQVPAAGRLEVAFSPDEGADELEVKLIRSAAHKGGAIRMLAYAFTSATETRALLEARAAGAEIQLVADEKENTSEDRSGKARAALSALANAGVDVRLIRVYAIHHDKVTIVGNVVNRQVVGDSVGEGSFNFTEAAAHRNSENLLVNWNNPQLAAVYLAHFERNYAQSEPFAPRY